ncbi:MAG TPA: hypothetical protein VEJ46_04465 [Candidatus Acidoferrum sp.]|nr:hypothetical protein [Candidatus Acidoferrum sp.]
MEKRRMTAKHNLREFTAFRTGWIDSSVGSQEIIGLEERLAIAQELEMWLWHSRHKFAANVPVRLAQVASNSGQTTHPRVFEEGKFSREKGQQANLMITGQENGIGLAVYNLQQNFDDFT